MGVKEILSSIGERHRNRKELLRQLDERYRAEEMIEERRKSANQRELERYMKEENEKEIKRQLEYMREARQKDINFNHNPLKIPNIVKSDGHEILKTPSIFNHKSTILHSDKSVLTNNPNLMRNSKWLMI